MPNALNVAGDVVQAASALSGLTLVFLGTISASFDRYQKAEQAAVRGRFQLRAWFAFAGFVLALIATVLAVAGRWFTSECAALAALVIFAIALVWVLFAGLFAVREIR